jgi:dephospho-CoA kinase
MILRVGLTGGIASGKSTVGRHLEHLGAVVIDADRVVAELYQPGRAGHRALVGRYGQSILTTDGEIDRAALSRTALSTPEGAAELNALVHPLVIAEEARRMATLAEGVDNRIVVVEATLLLESGGRSRYDRVIVVDTDPELQIARAVGRGLPEPEVRLRLSRQMDRTLRLDMADFVIDSSGAVEDTLRRTEEVWRQLVDELLRLAK